MSGDELELFFASNRHGGGDDLDIYVATRDSDAAPFSQPTRLTNLSTNQGSDWPVWLSPDRCALYYIGKVGKVATLYVATR